MQWAFTTVARSMGCFAVSALSPLLAAAKLMLIGCAACGLASAQPLLSETPLTSPLAGAPDARLVVTGTRLPVTQDLMVADVVVIDGSIHVQAAGKGWITLPQVD